MEYWKDIHGYDGSYQVSNLGRVRRVRVVRATSRNRMVKFEILNCSTNGIYPKVTLGGRSGQAQYIHRLVALHFIPIPARYDDTDRLEVDHIDGDCTNNVVENLRWCLPKENCNFALHRRNLSQSKRGCQVWNKGLLRPLSEETYKSISEKAKARLRDKTNHPNYGKGKAVALLDEEGMAIRTFCNAREAGEYLGCSRDLIRDVCTGKTRRAKGYRVAYV